MKGETGTLSQNSLQRFIGIGKPATFKERKKTFYVNINFFLNTYYGINFYKFSL